jgi:thiamine-monophosphate kinase
MKLSELGERRAIKIFEDIYGDCEKAVLAIGDDACVLELDPRHYLVASTDLLSRRTHFPLEMPPRVIGRYAVNACLSDIASMGAEPLGLLFSYGLPGDTREDFIRGIAQGIRDACREHGTCVLGGDTKEQGELLITATALGKVRRDRLLLRSGARVGDLILVTGEVGTSAAGYHAIIHGLRAPERAIEAAYRPNARVREGILLGKYATSCIDVSDGIAFSLHEIARASQVGFRIHEDRLPVDHDSLGIAGDQEERDEILYHKGGEYELLFTLPEDRYDALRKEFRSLGTRLSVIGVVTDRGGEVVRGDGSVKQLEYRGYEAFRQSP